MQNNLTSTMLAIAGAMACKSGIQLVIDPFATTFKTDGKRLIIPPIAKLTKDFPALQELETYIIGAVIHEAGHIRFTDRDVRVAYKMSFDGHAKYAMADAVGQCLEDLVIERAQCNALPGARSALSRLWKLLYGRHTIQEVDVHEEAAFSNYVFYRARHSVLKTEWTLAACEASLQQLSSKFSPDHIDLIESELALLDLISSTADGSALAIRLLRLVGVEPEAPAEDVGKADSGNDIAEQPEEGMSQPTSGHEDPANGQGPGQPQSGGAKGGFEQPTDGPIEPENQESSSCGDLTSLASQAQSGNEPDVTTTLPAENEEVSRIGAAMGFAEMDLLEEITTAVQELQSELPEGTEYELLVPSSIPGHATASTDFMDEHRGGMELKSKILVLTMMASARLSTLLKAQTESRTEYTKRGTIVPSRLWKLQAGNTRVFRQTVEGRELNTAIKILLDRSYSMKKTIQSAIESACFLPLAFDDVSGISTSVDIFPGTDRYATTLKRFEDRTTPCLDVLASVVADGGTPLGAALKISGMDLVQFNAERRLLVVITDGRPDRLEEAKAELKKLEEADVEIIGIGIGVSLKHLFADFVSVRHVGELTDVLYHVMERKLIRLPLAA